MVVLGDINTPRVVRVGAPQFLQRHLSFPGQQPVDKYLGRVGMRCARRDAKGAAGRAEATAFFPFVRVEIADRQLLLTALPTSLPALHRMHSENFPVDSQSVIWRGSRPVVICISP